MLSRTMSNASAGAGGAAPPDLDALRAHVTAQGGAVRQLKKDGAEASVLAAAVASLTALRAQLEALQAAEAAAGAPGAAGGGGLRVDKAALENLLSRRMFVVPSFEIHGGVSGLFDYGPPGCALKENLLALWRQHFVLEDALLQIECTTLTPYAVLKTSGHVDKFEDLMVKDTKTGECLRADKLLEDWVENTLKAGVGPPPLKEPLTQARRDELRKIGAQADAYEPQELSALFKQLGIKSPATGADLTEPFPFNLMFGTQIGPTGQLQGFLRPETAQGMFVNFRRLYDYNQARMPMGIAQIGTAYRNEIAPRGGLIRVREFTMAEIEFFVHPERKEHAKFASVAGERLQLFAAANQVGDGKCVSPTLGEAVATGVINNQTLAYFMARTASFLHKLGIKPDGLRFRQHLRTEMAHYACDCWDAEILMAQGWVESVGIADRSAFDLAVHAKATKVDLVARELFAEPREESFVAVKPNKQAIGKAFKAEQKAVMEALEALALDEPRALAFQAQLAGEAGAAELPLAPAAPGGAPRAVSLTRDMVALALETRRVSERKYVPNVIEPSFGIGRILTGVFEHCFYVREGDVKDGDLARSVLALPARVAPFKCVVLPLDGRIAPELVQSVYSGLLQAGLSAQVDDSSGSIGKRYSRADELGTPFAITVDFESASDRESRSTRAEACAARPRPCARASSRSERKSASAEKCVRALLPPRLPPAPSRAARRRVHRARARQHGAGAAAAGRRDGHDPRAVRGLRQVGGRGGAPRAERRRRRGRLRRAALGAVGVRRGRAN